MEKSLWRKTEYGTRMKEVRAAERERERKDVLRIFWSQRPKLVPVRLCRKHCRGIIRVVFLSFFSMLSEVWGLEFFYRLLFALCSRALGGIKTLITKSITITWAESHKVPLSLATQAGRTLGCVLTKSALAGLHGHMQARTQVMTLLVSSVGEEPPARDSWDSHAPTGPRHYSTPNGPTFHSASWNVLRAHSGYCTPGFHIHWTTCKISINLLLCG